MNINSEEIDQVLKDDNWAFLNSLLYKMCAEHFDHRNVDVVTAKICMIGRTYSASIERRKIRHKKIASDEFYERIVAPEIIRSDIDKWLSYLRKVKTISERDLPDILKTHSQVMKLLKRISGMDNRSLTSKYLHFHLPCLFYIYDSRAVKGLRQIFPGFRVKNRYTGYDEEYSRFCQRLFYLQEKVKEKFGEKLTTRQLDKLLLLKA